MLLKFLLEKLNLLQMSGFLLVPIGIATNQEQHDVIVIVENVDTDVFRVTIVNSDPNHGAAFHGVSPSAIPLKDKFRSALCLGTVSKETITDMSWWMWLFVFRCIRNDKNNASELYGVLGWLKKIPFDVLVDRFERGNPQLQVQGGEFRSSQMGSTSFYRVVQESFFSLCRSRGVPSSSVKFGPTS